MKTAVNDSASLSSNDDTKYVDKYKKEVKDYIFKEIDKLLDIYNESKKLDTIKATNDFNTKNKDFRIDLNVNQ